MSVNLVRIKSLLVAKLNLADSYTPTPDGGSRGYDQQFTDAILDADGEVVAAGLSNPTWSHRIDFVGSTTVAHGATIPSHIGPIDAVLVGGRVASPAPLDQIESERDLVTQGMTTVTPHYNLDGFVLAHNGASNATLKYVTYTRGVACQAPDELEGAVFRGAAKIVSNIEGEDYAMEQTMDRQFSMDLQMIAAGQIPPPIQQ